MQIQVRLLRSPRALAWASLFVFLFGLSPGQSAHAQLQDKAQARCLTQLARATTKLVRAQGRVIDDCSMQLASRVGNYFACPLVDPQGKIAKAEAKLRSIDAEACHSPEPDFAYTPADALIRAAKFNRLDIVQAATFSWDHVRDSPSFRCGQNFLKGQAKIFEHKLRGFELCLKRGLADGSIQSNAAAANCILGFDADTDAKLARLLAKVLQKNTKLECENPAPDVCRDGYGIDECVDQFTSLRACGVASADGTLSIDCRDTFGRNTLQEYESLFGSSIGVCGNGRLEGAEECDDGNRISGDGCDFFCTVSRCGNDVTDPTEHCEPTSIYWQLVFFDGKCVGGDFDGLPCAGNAICTGGYCTNCATRCNAECSGCVEPSCVEAVVEPPAVPTSAELYVRAPCLGRFCNAGRRVFPCREMTPTSHPETPHGNCILGGVCVPATEAECLEFEGTVGTCAFDPADM